MNFPVIPPPGQSVESGQSDAPGIPVSALMPSGVTMKREFTFHHELPPSLLPSPKVWFVRLIEFAEKIVPILAALGGAGWVLYRFATFQRTHETLQLELDKLSFEREKVSSQTLADERSYSLEMARLNLRRMGRELANLEDHPLREDASLKLRKLDTLPGGCARFSAVLNLVITNISQQPVDITFSVVRQYRGIIKKRRPGGAVFARINGPLETGVVDWKLASEFAGFRMAANEDAPEQIQLDGQTFDLTPGGGLTGHLRPAEQRSFSFDYLIVDKSEAFVGFVIDVGVNGAAVPADHRVFRKWEALFEADNKVATAAEDALPKSLPDSKADR